MEDITVDHVDNTSNAKIKTQTAIRPCRENAQLTLQSTPTPLTPETTSKIIDDLSSCMISNTLRQLQKAHTDMTFQTNIRRKIADVLEDYVCADEMKGTSDPIETWYLYDEAESEREVNVLHESERSRIHLISDFISRDECEAVERAARNRYYPAAILDETGRSVLSNDRKAMQANVKIPWGSEDKRHPLAVLSRRVYEYTNYVTDYGLEEFGQEDLMSIHYTGRGEHDPYPDRYKPHCDGNCSSKGPIPHKDGDRVATMIMYCTIPEKGGATHFKNAGIKLSPKEGDGLLFSYMGSDMTMDDDYTVHSGCPVIVGEKKIVVQWMRYGVSEDYPWHLWDTGDTKYEFVS